MSSFTKNIMADISPQLKWGKQNDANEFFLALVQTFVNDTRYDDSPQYII